MNLRDKFTVIIRNSNNAAKRVVLANGNVDTERIYSVTGQNNTVSYLHDFTSADKIREEIDTQADIALDDTGSAGVGSIVMLSRSNGSIRSILAHLRHNPRKIARIVISSNDVSLFKGNLTIGSNVPFGKPTLKEIAIDDYFSTNQFQNDKVIMDFSASPIEWNDMLYMSIDVPSASANDVAAEATISVEFAD
ncbi:MAG: hypothetical protein IJU81_02560 [Bacteroidales bacterium]|nr:hypothetical protein [Bacteroidales bacterium]